jgi:predicted HAD superfamily phosphohydrolase YqeG
MFVDAKLVKSIQELAPETIDGRPVRHLLVDFDLAALAENDERVAEAVRELVAETALDEQAARLKLDHWVDVENGFIRRQRVAMDSAVRGGSLALSIVLDYTKIGQPIQPPIEAPR